MTRPATLLLILLCGNALAADWFTPHAKIDVGVNSSYISRAKVYENTLIQENDINLYFDLSDYGRIGLYHWNYSSLDTKYTDKYRQAFPEFDWMPYYGYEWKFTEGWSLDNEVRVQWKTYYGGIPEDDPTSFELYLKQSLKSPYVTLYHAFRYTFEPDKWAYYVIGLKRGFRVCRYLKLTPQVSTDFADGEGRYKRFGARADGSTYGSGILSIVAELKAEVPISEWFSIYVAVGQFDVLCQDGRDNLKHGYQRDLTYGKAGISLSF